MDGILKELQKRIAKAPTDPGVYQWLDKNGSILYTGKAKNLRNRLKSYVQDGAKKGLGPWKLSLLEQITDFDVTVTNNELEALVLETNLIKEQKPKYNVLMKDDKHYVYVEITVDDDFPSVDVVRRMSNDKAKYFGPFLSSYEIKRTLDLLHDVFHFRACKESIKNANAGKKNGERACLDYQIGKCNGLCIEKVDKAAYRKAIEEVMRFLRGDHSETKKTVLSLMQEAATEKKFERAAKLRDTLGYIEKLEERQLVSDTTGDNLDVIAIAVENQHALAIVMKQREGKLIAEQSFNLSGLAENAAEVLEQFLPQLYGDTQDIPEIIIVSDEVEDGAVLADWLSNLKGKKVSILVPERGKKSQLLKLAEKNAHEKIRQQETKWEEAARNAETAMKELEELLNLSAAPKRIEGYDISHLGGTETVGSMVVMKNGKAANDQYRSFTVRTLKEGDIDDYKALRETLRRRLRYISNEEKRLEEKGVTFGKAKKADQAQLESILENEEKLSSKDIDYKSFLVARKGVEIIGLGQLISHKPNTIELSSIWVSDKHRGMKIGQLLARKLIKKCKEQKIYITVEPELEEYYAEIGFRYIQNPPEPIQKELERIEKEESYDPGFAMVYIVKEHKDDKSLLGTPDLLVIDGGKGQLNAATEVLQELELKIPVIGLAKREEDVFVPGEKAPVLFPNDSQGKFLLMRLRNEAHRFANKLRETKGKKAAVASALDEVEGIGPKTKQDLLKKFGSVTNIKKASDEDLAAVLNEAQLASLREKL